MADGRRPAVAFTVLAAVVACAGVVIVYGGHLGAGFYYDDYHFNRPWSALELRRVWFGSWDPSGIEYVFYRPLTAWLYAGRFWALGLNASAMHVASVAGHAFCAVLTGWALRRERVPAGLALLGVWLYAVHPLFPYAQVSWLTNQMHLAESFVVVGALLIWQTARDRSWIWWTPLPGLAAIGFLIKEDAVMLLPALAILTLLRRWLLGAGPRRWWPLALCGAVVVAGLLGFRYARLGRLGGYSLPTLAVALENAWKGVKSTLALWPTRRPWQGVASAIAMAALTVGVVIGGAGRRRWALTAAAAAIGAWLIWNTTSLLADASYPKLTWQGGAAGVTLGMLLVGGAIALWRDDRASLYLLGAGITIVLCFNLPFVLVSKREQYHLLALGGVVVFAGAAQALVTAIRPGARHPLAVFVLAMLPLPILARAQAADFAPCASGVLEADAGTAGWWVTPLELKRWLQEKAERCAAGVALEPLADVPLVIWGAYDVADPSGERSRWTSDHAVLFARQQAQVLTLAVRRTDATQAAPVHVNLAGGITPTAVTLDSSDWKYATIRLSPSLLARLRAGHRIDVRIAPWFVPAASDPRSTDLRRLGVELRIVALQ